MRTSDRHRIWNRLQSKAAAALRACADRLTGERPPVVGRHPLDAWRACGDVHPSARYEESSCILAAGARVRIGPESIFLGRLVFHRPGEFVMGARTYVGPDTEIHIAQRVTLGDDTMVAWGCSLMDTDNHSLRFDERANDVLITGRFRGLIPDDKDWSSVRCEPIHIAPQVWIGARAIVLPGVRIGRAAVVGAGSVVARSLPDLVIAVGNPARVVRQIEEPARRAHQARIGVPLPNEVAS